MNKYIEGVAYIVIVIVVAYMSFKLWWKKKRINKEVNKDMEAITRLTKIYEEKYLEEHFSEKLKEFTDENLLEGIRNSFSLWRLDSTLSLEEKSALLAQHDFIIAELDRRGIRYGHVIEECMDEVALEVGVDLREKK